MFTEGRRGFEIVDPVQDAAVVYEMRQRLEGLAARLAAEVITVPELEALNAVQARMMAIIESADPSRSLDELAELNGLFHSRINSACRRPRLIHLIEQLSPIYISRQIVMLYSQEERKHSIEEHAEILAALWGRDAERAEQLIHRHLKGGKRFMLGDDTVSEHFSS
jgi:DNA-binding GntR family transcriptional regulator